MKPSEIIQEQTLAFVKKHAMHVGPESLANDPINFCTLLSAQIQSILDYLDKQAEPSPNEDTEVRCKNCGFSNEIGHDGICWSSVCKGAYNNHSKSE